MTLNKDCSSEAPSREELKAWRAAHWDGPFNDAKNRLCDALLSATAPIAAASPTKGLDITCPECGVTFDVRNDAVQRALRSGLSPVPQPATPANARAVAEKCAEIAENTFGGPSRKCSENSDTYAIQDASCATAAMRIRAYAASLPADAVRPVPHGTMAALQYLLDSTASEGQWADQAVHSFVGAMLKQSPHPAPAALPAQLDDISESVVEAALAAGLGRLVDTRHHWTAEDRAITRSMIYEGIKAMRGSYVAALPEAPQPATQRSDLADIKELAMFWSRMPSGATDVLSNAGACRLARAYLDALDVINATPLSETPPSGTANDLVAPRGHDEAHARINQCFREIEIICDTFGYDPAQWLVIDDGDMASMQPSNNGSTT